jgi:imidazolonepropionase-like amidohydrolase
VCGNLAPGAAADFCLWDAGTPDELVLRPGRRACLATFVAGEERQPAARGTLWNVGRDAGQDARQVSA